MYPLRSCIRTDHPRPVDSDEENNNKQSNDEESGDDSSSYKSDVTEPDED